MDKYHITHEWQCNSKFHRCHHGPLPTEGRVAEWIKPNTEAFTALQKIVLHPKLLGDLDHLTEFSHSGLIEVKHALDNKWAPKSTHFSYQSMLARGQLAIIDFNLGADLEQAETSGEKRCYQACSKMTKSWAIKPIKWLKDRQLFQDMVDRTVDVVINKEQLPGPDIPVLPSNIATVEKPDKKEAVARHRSRLM